MNAEREFVTADPVFSRGGAGIACAILAGIALLNALLLNSSNGIIDDAYIFFRYVDNLLAGHGLTWNPGELGHDRVEGYTSFLYVMVIALPRALGADPVVAAHVINVGLFAGLVLLSVAIVRRAFRGLRPAALVAPCLLATSAALGQASRTGIELMLFAFTIIAACALHLRGGERWRDRLLSGAAFGLVVLTRPEGLLVYAVCVLVSLWEDRTRGLGHAILREARRATGLALVVLPHLAWRLWYYGEPLPNTYYAKVGYSLANVARGLEGLLHFLATLRGGLAVAALVAWAMAPPSRTGRIFASLLFAWIGYGALFLGLPDWRTNYTVPIDWFALLTLGHAAGALLAETQLAARAPLALAGLLLVLANLSPALARKVGDGSPWTPRLIDEPDGSMICGFVDIGKKLGEIAGPGDTVAVGACGAIPYFSGLVTYDTLGLNDKHIARQPVKFPGQAAFGHEKGDGAYIAEKRPTYLIPLPQPTPEPTAGYLEFSVTFSEITAITEFRSQYEFRSVQLDDGRYFNYFELSER